MDDTLRIFTMTVRSVDEGWALFIEAMEDPAWTVSTKDRAIKAARSAAAYHNALLTVRHQDGLVQQIFDYQQDYQMNSEMTKASDALWRWTLTGRMRLEEGW